VDVLLAVVVVGCALAGAFWGAVRMAAGLAAAVAAVAAGRFAGAPAARLLTSAPQPGAGAHLAGVALVAIVAAGVVLLAGRGLRRGLVAVHLSCLDRLAGAVLAGVLAVVVLAALLGLAAQGGYEPRGAWSARLAHTGLEGLALQRQRSSSTPSSTPAPATSNGQHPTGDAS
jgi:uncharacterized membrane protein required for colicin V production